MTWAVKCFYFSRLMLFWKRGKHSLNISKSSSMRQKANWILRSVIVAFKQWLQNASLSLWKQWPSLENLTENHLIKLGSWLNTNVININSSSSIIVIIIITIRVNQVARSTSLLPLIVIALNRWLWRKNLINKCETCKTSWKKNRDKLKTGLWPLLKFPQQYW